jgi:hypothetical protein
MTGVAASSFVIIDDFDFIGIARAELKTNAPSCVYPHRPLVLPSAFELVKANASQGAKLPQRRCYIESKQQIDRSFEIQAAKLVRPLAFPTLRVATLRQVRITARMYYRKQ